MSKYCYDEKGSFICPEGKVDFYDWTFHVVDKIAMIITVLIIGKKITTMMVVVMVDVYKRQHYTSTNQIITSVAVIPLNKFISDIVWVIDGSDS